MKATKSTRDSALEALQEFSRLSKLLICSIVDISEERGGENPEEIMGKLLTADKKLQDAVQKRVPLRRSITNQYSKRGTSLPR